VRLFADTNIMAATVRALRADGHDVVYSAERPEDPGDEALLAEAYAGDRVFVTKDHDFGALVFRDGAAHAGVLLIDDSGNPIAEARLVVDVMRTHGEALSAGAFVRANASEMRIMP